ncbi:MAG: EamA family transporter RarD [Woeseiaceae bacterium]|nr:EamA family transporter RarD [Woeseiaceae bacterium]
MGLTAYFLWGVLPLYLIAISDVPALEVLAHRVLWAVPFGALIITARKQWGEVRVALTHRLVFMVLVAAAGMISINWLVYIYAVQSAQVFQASLGYYINPLIFVAVGMLFFGEHLRALQKLAVLLAAAGVMILTVSGGQFPTIAMVLAISFTIYSIIRKKALVGAMPGLFVETLILLPFAIAWLVYMSVQGEAVFPVATLDMQLLLIMAGPITVVPLLCFAIAARRLRMATVGFMQFLAPSLQFLIGYLHGESLSLPHLVCFLFIWAAVIAFSTDALRNSRRPRIA